jgi:hypothetical protein
MAAPQVGASSRPQRYRTFGRNRRPAAESRQEEKRVVDWVRVEGVPHGIGPV